MDASLVRKNIYCKHNISYKMFQVVTFVPAVSHLHVMLSGLNLLASWTMLEMS